MSTFRHELILDCLLAKGPEVRVSSGGKTWAKMRLKVVETYQGRETSFFANAVCFGADAEGLKEAREGDPVSIRGKLKMNAWTDKEDKKHYDLEIMAFNVVPYGDPFPERGERQARREEPQRREEPAPSRVGGGYPGPTDVPPPDDTEIPF